MNYFNPQRMPVLPAGRRVAARQQLEQLVARSARSRRRGSPGLIAAGVTAVVLGTGAAAAVAAYQPVTNKTQARCYTVADAASSRYTTIAPAGRPGSRAQVQDALSVCAALFRQGFLTVGGPGISRLTSGKGNHPVPRLVACTMSDGTASVFPGGPSTCARLSLPAASNP